MICLTLSSNVHNRPESHFQSYERPTPFLRETLQTGNQLSLFSVEEQNETELNSPVFKSNTC